MVPKGHRLCRDESSRADREGFRVSQGALQARVLPNIEAKTAKYVVIAGKKASPSSVDRHTIRRRVSAAMEDATTQEQFLGDVVVRVRSDVSKTPFDELVTMCRALLTQR